jgi:hypothetical protein
MFLGQDFNIFSSVVDPDPDCIRIQWGPRIRIRNPDPDPGGQIRPTEIKKISKFNFLKFFFED